ncbi:hypothetical protein [uncultured Bacteroides sp.]|uniref:hypothetical protein n=1 Tax=uncultured Bacteroides sp. TaxID=162156 RepID=UPI00280C0C8B|nr:hypothetical protein [uncultured Bacteroides sp.]
MKLKYNLIAWSLLGFFAAACDPMDDIYNEIDAEGTTNTQTMAEYVLTDADYETISSAAGLPLRMLKKHWRMPSRRIRL